VAAPRHGWALAGNPSGRAAAGLGFWAEPHGETGDR
jgi:hypothetical protein